MYCYTYLNSGPLLHIQLSMFYVYLLPSRYEMQDYYESSIGYFSSCKYIFSLSERFTSESSITYHHLLGIDKLKRVPFNSMEGCIWGIPRMWRWRLGWGNFAPPTLRKLPTTYCHHAQNLNPKITSSSVKYFEQATQQKPKPSKR